MYVLLDLKRRKLGVRELVTVLEQTVVNTLAELDIDAHPRADAPGVYVGEKKICSLGLRIRKGCSFHGLTRLPLGKHRLVLDQPHLIGGSGITVIGKGVHRLGNRRVRL